MKYRIVKIIALLVILVHVSSCHKKLSGDNRRPGKGHYKPGGRYW